MEFVLKSWDCNKVLKCEQLCQWDTCVHLLKYQWRLWSHIKYHLQSILCNYTAWIGVSDTRTHAVEADGVRHVAGRSPTRLLLLGLNHSVTPLCPWRPILWGWRREMSSAIGLWYMLRGNTASPLSSPAIPADFSTGVSFTQPPLFQGRQYCYAENPFLFGFSA